MHFLFDRIKYLLIHRTFSSTWKILYFHFAVVQRQRMEMLTIIYVHHIVVFRCVDIWQHDPEWMMGAPASWNKHSAPLGNQTRCKLWEQNCRRIAAWRSVLLEEVIFHSPTIVPVFLKKISDTRLLFKHNVHSGWNDQVNSSRLPRF